MSAPAAALTDSQVDLLAAALVDLLADAWLAQQQRPRPGRRSFRRLAGRSRLISRANRLGQRNAPTVKEE